MYLRIVFSLFFISLCFSCDFFGKMKDHTFILKDVDTVIDYTKVDVLPSFPVCDSILDVTQKNRCFINALYNHFSKELLTYTFDIPETVNEIVTVRLQIDAGGKASLISIESSDVVKNEIPLLNSIISESIVKLPVLFPALKRGIPVTTVYELPIVIKLK